MARRDSWSKETIRSLRKAANDIFGKGSDYYNLNSNELQIWAGDKNHRKAWAKTVTLASARGYLNDQNYDPDAVFERYDPRDADTIGDYGRELAQRLSALDTARDSRRQALEGTVQAAQTAAVRRALAATKQRRMSGDSENGTKVLGSGF